jgi:hypothetical protein
MISIPGTGTERLEPGDSPVASPPVTTHWEQLVTVALLGTDRRDPPEFPGPVADLVADAMRPSPAERMLAEVAAVTAIRRGGLVPLAPATPLPRPSVDDRPECPRRASDRWRHLVVSWPVLEDEWMIALIERGWRVDPELVAPMLARHRRDPARWQRAVVGAGPLAEWLVGFVPTLAVTNGGRGGGSIVERDGVVGLELPDLPIPDDLRALRTASGTEVGEVVAAGLVAGRFGPAHRIVLVNLLARVPADGLADIETALRSVQNAAIDFPLAASLLDITHTRRSMLLELARPDASDR